MGDEFGPWILHFDARDGCSTHPTKWQVSSRRTTRRSGAAATQPNSRGFEAMAISRNGKFLHAALEGATLADADQNRRNVYEFSIRRRRSPAASSTTEQSHRAT